jgi:hypothetical protein
VTIRRALEDVPVDAGAEERAWAVVRSAYRDRVPAARRRPRWPLAAVALAAAVVASVLSPPGRAVVDAVRRSIGVPHAAPALFRLPAPGRLLVAGEGGTWVVSADGSKRRLGGYGQAAWSPHGLFVAAASRDSLAAVEPGSGDVRWSLARRGISSPSWGGTRTDTRLAYLSGGMLRVVGGDGRGDRAVGLARQVVPVWQPERLVVAYAARLGVVVRDAASGAVVARHAARGVRQLAWSPDGATLVAVVPRAVLAWRGGRTLQYRIAGVHAVAFAADGRLALLRSRDLLVVDEESGGKRTVFKSPSALAGVAWSPNGRWLVTTLPAADQLVFVGPRGVRAVDGLSRQLGGSASLDGWAAGA